MERVEIRAQADRARNEHIDAIVCMGYDLCENKETSSDIKLLKEQTFGKGGLFPYSADNIDIAKRQLDARGNHSFGGFLLNYRAISKMQNSVGQSVKIKQGEAPLIVRIPLRGSEITIGAAVYALSQTDAQEIGAFNDFSAQLQSNDMQIRLEAMHKILEHLDTMAQARGIEFKD